MAYQPPPERKPVDENSRYFKMKAQDKKANDPRYRPEPEKLYEYLRFWAILWIALIILGFFWSFFYQKDQGQDILVIGLVGFAISAFHLGSIYIAIFFWGEDTFRRGTPFSARFFSAKLYLTNYPTWVIINGIGASFFGLLVALAY